MGQTTGVGLAWYPEPGRHEVSLAEGVLCAKASFDSWGEGRKVQFQAPCPATSGVESPPRVTPCANSQKCVAAVEEKAILRLLPRIVAPQVHGPCRSSGSARAEPRLHNAPSLGCSASAHAETIVALETGKLRRQPNEGRKDSISRGPGEKRLDLWNYIVVQPLSGGAQIDPWMIPPLPDRSDD